MNFKDQLFHSSPLGDKITFVSSVKQSKCKCLLYFMIGLNFQESYAGYEICWSVTNHLIIFQIFGYLDPKICSICYYMLL